MVLPSMSRRRCRMKAARFPQEPSAWLLPPATAYIANALLDSLRQENFAMLTVLGKEAGACQICLAAAMVYKARFKDGLRGDFCQDCLLNLFDKRNGKEDPDAHPKGREQLAANIAK